MSKSHAAVQPTITSRQSATAWRLTKWSMAANILLLLVFVGLSVFGIMANPWFVAATNDIHPHILTPLTREQALRMVDEKLPPVDTKGPLSVPLDGDGRLVETPSVYRIGKALEEMDEADAARKERERDDNPEASEESDGDSMPDSARIIPNREIIPLDKAD